MNYQDQLNPWVINHVSPDLNRSVVCRFRRRAEAEAYVKVIQQMRPKATFVITFESASGETIDLPSSATRKVKVKPA